jgi:hypothetical protein
VLFETPIYCVYVSCDPVLDILDILDIVQTCPSCPTCPKGAIQNNLQKLRGFESAKFGTIIACAKTGVRADPDSSRQERLVAIASVALLKRECGRSLKPRKKRGVWECAQWSKGRGRLVGGHGRVSQRSWECARSKPLDTMRRTRWRTCPDWVYAYNGREDTIWQKSGGPSEAGGVLRWLQPATLGFGGKLALMPASSSLM